MYYYYYYYAYKAKKVTFKMTFEVDKGEKLSLEEFNEFIGNINEIHNRIIFLTQPEYKKNNELIEFSKYKILNYHKLEIKHICRKNPFNIELVFTLIPEGLVPYWTIWKLLIKFCKRYGKDANQLNNTTETILNFFKDLFDELSLNSQNDTIATFYKNQNELLLKINEWINEFLTDKETSEVYNFFCSTSIRVTKLLSFSEIIFNEENPVDLLKKDNQNTEL